MLYYRSTCVVTTPADSTVEPLYRGHTGTLETVLCIEVVLNSEVIVQWNLSIKNTFGPWKLSFIIWRLSLYREVPLYYTSELRTTSI